MSLSGCTGGSRTLSRVTWSSCESIPKPGMRLAKSTTPLMAGEKRSLKSSRIRFVPPLSMTCCGKGLRGQAFGRKEWCNRLIALSVKKNPRIDCCDWKESYFGPSDRYLRQMNKQAQGQARLPEDGRSCSCSCSPSLLPSCLSYHSNYVKNRNNNGKNT